MSDRVHQMGLAEAHAAIEKQRVVRSRRRFRYRATGRVRELIRGADDEGLERVAAAQTGGVGGLLYDDWCGGCRRSRRFLGGLHGSILTLSNELKRDALPPDLSQGLLD